MLPTGSHPWRSRSSEAFLMNSTVGRWASVMDWSRDNLSLGKVFWWLGWGVGLTAVVWQLLT